MHAGKSLIKLISIYFNVLIINNALFKLPSFSEMRKILINQTYRAVNKL